MFSLRSKGFEGLLVPSDVASLPFRRFQVLWLFWVRHRLGRRGTASRTNLVPVIPILVSILLVLLHVESLMNFRRSRIGSQRGLFTLALDLAFLGLVDSLDDLSSSRCGSSQNSTHLRQSHLGLFDIGQSSSGRGGFGRQRQRQSTWCNCSGGAQASEIHQIVSIQTLASAQGTRVVILGGSTLGPEGCRTRRMAVGPSHGLSSPATSLLAWFSTYHSPIR